MSSSVTAAASRQAAQRRRARQPDQAAIAQAWSWCRSGQYDRVAALLDAGQLAPGACDAAGNTLLHVAAQNGNKRIAKLALRRGADINAQNLNGQTCLHFCYAYRYTALGEYLKGKGADDSLANADGLTCYEGLERGALDRL